MFKNESDFNFWVDKAKRDGATDDKIHHVLTEWYYKTLQSEVFEDYYKGDRTIPSYIINYLQKQDKSKLKLNNIHDMWNDLYNSLSKGDIFNLLMESIKHNNRQINNESSNIETHITEIKHELERYRRIAYRLKETNEDSRIYNISIRVMDSTKKTILEKINEIQEEVIR